MYNKPMKVKILEATYDESTDMVFWLLELPNGDKYPMPWPLKSIESVLAVKGNVTPKLIEEFHQKIIGNEITIIIKPPEKIPEMPEDMK